MFHDRIIDARELCCRRIEMRLIQEKRIIWDSCQVGTPGAMATDKENGGSRSKQKVGVPRF